MIRLSLYIILFLATAVNLGFLFFQAEVFDNIAYFNPLAYMSVGVFLVIHVLYVLEYKNPFTVLSIMSLFLWLFVFGRVVLYVLGDQHVLVEFESFVQEILPLRNVFVALVAANLVIYGMYLGFLLFHKPKLSASIQEAYFVPGDQHGWREIFVKLTFLTAIPFAIKSYLEFKHILEIGYIAFYVGGLGDLNYYSPIIQYSHYLFLACYYFSLTLGLKKKQFFLLSVMFVTMSFFDSLKGARVLFILPLLYVIWHYYKFYVPKMNLRRIVVFSFIFLVSIGLFAEVAKRFRTNEAIDLTLIDVPRILLEETGKTLQIAALYSKYQEDMGNKAEPFFLEPIVYPYKYFKHFKVITGGQSAELIQVRNSLNHQLTYYMNPGVYIRGNGLGSTIVAELFEVGFFFLFLLSLFIGALIAFLENNLKQKWLIFLAPILVRHIFFIPRETPFINLIVVLKFVFIYLSIKLFIYFWETFFPTTERRNLEKSLLNNSSGLSKNH